MVTFTTSLQSMRRNSMKDLSSQPSAYLGRDNEHVFEVERYDLDNPTHLTVTVWLPAFRCRINDKEVLTHTAQSSFGGSGWATEPKLVRIDDIAHRLTPAQLADMRRPDPMANLTRARYQTDGKAM